MELGFGALSSWSGRQHIYFRSDALLFGSATHAGWCARGASTVGGVAPDRLSVADRAKAVDHGRMPVANIVFPHPADAVAVARSVEGGRLAVEHVSPGDWLQVGKRLFGGAQVPLRVASPPSDHDDVVVFLDAVGFEALAPASVREAYEDELRLCAARSGERVALRVEPEPSAALVLMDTEVRALAAGAHLVVGEAAEKRPPMRPDRAASLPLPISLVRGVVSAVDLL